MMKILAPTTLTSLQDYGTLGILAALDIRTKELTFTNAGLIEPLLKSAESVAFIQGDGATIPLGMKCENVYREKTMGLKSRDVVILVTDGISEPRNHGGEFFGEQRLRDLLQALDTRNLSAAAIKDKIIGEVKCFSGIAHQHDDMTVIVIKSM